MKIQFVTTPSGDEMAILPRADYEALLARLAELEEDEADLALYDVRKSLPSDPLPTDITARMLRGDSLLKAIRSWRGLTQVEVDRQTGIGQGYLSDLESGRRKGGDATLRKLARLYDVPPSWLVAARHP